MSDHVATRQTSPPQRADPQRSALHQPSRAAGTGNPPIWRLQRALGNRTMNSLLRSPIIQPKLTVSHPDDPYEREADRVADQVMRMSEPSGLAPIGIGPSGAAQRKCACDGAGGDCAECKERDVSTLQRTASNHVEPKHVPSIVHEVLRSPGQSLDTSTRAFMEPRFNQDFSGVRVHTDNRAAQSARAVNALAFTVGRNIVFSAGQYNPKSTHGQRLVAHELTHVVQQGHGLASAGRVMPYRDSSTANFGKCDTATMVEKKLKSRKTDPWIAVITVDFDSTTLDASGELIPKGTLKAVYSPNSAKLLDITTNVVGGQASQGLTDKGDHTVTRIEGCGYHHTSVPTASRIKGHKRAGKYFKPNLKSSATMNFAVFFVEGKSSGNQAIHAGSLSSGSLACVHVGNDDTIRQLNYHSVQGHTKVKVSYDATALAELCCARHKAVGRMVSNPCSGQDASKCP
jgi:uncharacterized protein DUF4157